MPGAFKIVPGLGDALHEAMRKISGVEEIAPAAEGLKIYSSSSFFFWDVKRISSINKKVTPKTVLHSTVYSWP